MLRSEFRGGYNLKIGGRPEQNLEQMLDIPDTIAVKAQDVPGLKALVKVREGDKVKSGDVLWVHKPDHRIQFVSPWNGTVQEIKRGKRRVLIEIILKLDKKQDFGKFGTINPDSASEQDFVNYLLKTGMWPFFKSMPFNVMADPEQRPRDIYIVTTDLEPHCPDLNYVLAGKEQKLQQGVKLLRLLTRGNIFVSQCKTSTPGPNWNAVEDVRVVEIQPTFPAGNPAVISFHVAPLRRNECAWTINAQDLLALVDLTESGKWNPARIMTVAGSLAKRRRYIETYLGSSVSHILNVDVEEGEKTYLSGGVFGGIETQEDGYLGFASTSLHVLPTGSQREFLRFVWPGLDKYSFSRTFLSSLFPQDEYKMTTSFQGEDRACIQCGHCEEVCPIDIKPQFLFKAVMASDYDEAEGLGLKDCAECGLCTYVCPSKIDLSGIIHDGLEEIRKEG
ncbi:MAG: NADH:ubiquinone reductase (Na(+)-transporting) subunit A [bacterium]|nr:NADH:ubiquinone reductase (Na(+)-transporting) subunit A [bacterium]